MNVLLTAANWGPIGVWAGAAATAAATGVALLSGTGQLDRYRQPHLSVSFEHAQPWTRHVTTDGTAKLWLRVSVDNTGRQPARGCVGHLTALATDDVDRADIDPVQLRWPASPYLAPSTPSTCAAANASTSTSSTATQAAPGRSTHSPTPTSTPDSPPHSTHVRPIGLASPSAATTPRQPP
jgi:hypothetical protein